MLLINERIYLNQYNSREFDYWSKSQLKQNGEREKRKKRIETVLLLALILREWSKENEKQINYSTENLLPSRTYAHMSTLSFNTSDDIMTAKEINTGSNKYKKKINK